jgi:hypothetical protein
MSEFRTLLDTTRPDVDDRFEAGGAVGAVTDRVDDRFELDWGCQPLLRGG